MNKTQHTYHKYNKNQVPRVSQCSKYDRTALIKPLVTGRYPLHGSSVSIISGHIASYSSI